jgi:hypothetical protein
VSGNRWATIHIGQTGQLTVIHRLVDASNHLLMRTGLKCRQL